MIREFRKNYIKKGVLNEGNPCQSGGLNENPNFASLKWATEYSNSLLQHPRGQRWNTCGFFEKQPWQMNVRFFPPVRLGTGGIKWYRNGTSLFFSGGRDRWGRGDSCREENNRARIVVFGIGWCELAKKANCLFFESHFSFLFFWRAEWTIVGAPNIFGRK